MESARERNATTILICKKKGKKKKKKSEMGEGGGGEKIYLNYEVTTSPTAPRTSPGGVEFCNK